MLSAILLTIGALVYLLVVPYPTSTENIIPYLHLARYVNYGRFFERIESIFVLIWSLAALSYLSVGSFFLIYIIKKTFRLQYYRPLILPISLILFTLCLMPQSLLSAADLEVNIFRKFAWIVTFGVPIVVLLLAKLVKRKKKVENAMKKYKVLIVVMFILLQCTMLTGCYDKRELDDMAYPVALGFDKGKANELRMTLQLAVPISIGGGSEGGGGGEGDKSVSVVTVDTPTIFSGLNMLNTFVSKQINLSHVKVIVFSDELAKEGISRYMHAMIRNREFRPNAHVIVSRGSAEKFINAVKPKLETNPAKYYEQLLNAYRYTGFTTDSQLADFYHNSESIDIQPVAVLAGINKFKYSDDFDISGSTYKEKGRDIPLEGDFKAGDLPKTGDLKIEIMGLAVFDGAKMVGEIDGEDTTYHLMLMNKFNSSSITIPDPLEKINW